MNLSDDLLDRAGRAYMRAVMDGKSGVEALRLVLDPQVHHHVDAISVENRVYDLDHPHDRQSLQDHISNILTRLRHVTEKLDESTRGSKDPRS